MSELSRLPQVTVVHQGSSLNREKRAAAPQRLTGHDQLGLVSASGSGPWHSAGACRATCRDCLHAPALMTGSLLWDQPRGFHCAQLRLGLISLSDFYFIFIFFNFKRQVISG